MTANVPPPAVVQATPATSATWTPHPIVGALLATERFLGEDRVWQAVNAEQDAFLAQTFARDRKAVPYQREMVSTASRTAAAVNAFLAEHDFDIHLDEMSGEGNIYAASILDLLVEWYEAGEVTTLTGRDGKTYPAVRIGRRNCLISRAPNGRIVVQLGTKSGDVVQLSITGLPDGAHRISAYVDSIAAGDLATVGDYDGVIFPMVSLDHTVDIGWLCGLHTTGEDGLPAVIAQALQQTRFRMNQFGARVESAAAVGVLRGYHAPKPYYVINEPFVLWISRQGLSVPLFVGYLAYPDWKDPGSLK